jgi:hypothetical protein
MVTTSAGLPPAVAGLGGGLVAQPASNSSPKIGDIRII